MERQDTTLKRKRNGSYSGLIQYFLFFACTYFVFIHFSVHFKYLLFILMLLTVVSCVFSTICVNYLAATYWYYVRFVLKLFLVFVVFV